jgi:DNA invertase Pin-like site-specific DNA recombinase
MRRYLFGHHGEQIAEFVEVETAKRSDRPQLAATMALAKKRKATLLVAKLDRLSRSVAFIATLMDSKGFDLAIADMPGTKPADASRARRRRARATYDRRTHTSCPCRRQGARHQAWQSRAGRDQPAKAAEQAQALRPHIERCIEAGRMSSSAIAADLNARGIAAPNGGQWFLMQVRRVRDRLGPMIKRACGIRPGG